MELNSILMIISLFISGIIIIACSLKLYDDYDGVYCFFEDKDWLSIPKALAQHYLNFFRLLFGHRILTLRGYLTITLLSVLLTAIIMIAWKGLVIGSFLNALNLFFTKDTFRGSIISWSLASAIVAPISLMITSKLLISSVESRNNKIIFRNLIFDLLSCYALVAICLYISMVTLMPSIQLQKGNLQQAYTSIEPTLAFAHIMALNWPSHNMVSIDGLSAKITSIAVLLPTAVLIILLALSFLSLLILWLTKPFVAYPLNWISKQTHAQFSILITMLSAMAGAIALLRAY